MNNRILNQKREAKELKIQDLKRGMDELKQLVQSLTEKKRGDY